MSAPTVPPIVRLHYALHVGGTDVPTIGDVVTKTGTPGRLTGPRFHTGKPMTEARIKELRDRDVVSLELVLGNRISDWRPDELIASYRRENLRLPLAERIVDHLEEHRAETFTPSGLSRALRESDIHLVRNTLVKLLKEDRIGATQPASGRARTNRWTRFYARKETTT